MKTGSFRLFTLAALIATALTVAPSGHAAADAGVCKQDRDGLEGLPVTLRYRFPVDVPPPAGIDFPVVPENGLFPNAVEGEAVNSCGGGAMVGILNCAAAAIAAASGDPVAKASLDAAASAIADATAGARELAANSQSEPLGPKQERFAEIELSVVPVFKPGLPTRISLRPGPNMSVRTNDTLSEAERLRLAGTIDAQLKVFGDWQMQLDTDVSEAIVKGQPVVAAAPKLTVLGARVAGTTAPFVLPDACRPYLAAVQKRDRIARDRGEKARDLARLEAMIEKKRGEKDDGWLASHFPFLDPEAISDALTGDAPWLLRAIRVAQQKRDQLEAVDERLTAATDLVDLEGGRLRDAQSDLDIEAIKADPDRLAQEQERRRDAMIGASRQLETLRWQRREGEKAYGEKLAGFDAMIKASEIAGNPAMAEQLQTLRNDLVIARDGWREAQDRMFAAREADVGRQILANREDGIGPEVDGFALMEADGVNPVEAITVPARQDARQRATRQVDLDVISAARGDFDVLTAEDFARDAYQAIPSNKEQRERYFQDVGTLASGAAEGAADAVYATAELGAATADLFGEDFDRRVSILTGTEMTNDPDKLRAVRSAGEWIGENGVEGIIEGVSSLGETVQRKLEQTNRKEALHGTGYALGAVAAEEAAIVGLGTALSGGKVAIARVLDRAEGALAPAATGGATASVATAGNVAPSGAAGTGTPSGSGTKTPDPESAPGQTTVLADGSRPAATGSSEPQPVGPSQSAVAVDAATPAKTPSEATTGVAGDVATDVVDEGLPGGPVLPSTLAVPDGIKSPEFDDVTVGSSANPPDATLPEPGETATGPGNVSPEPSHGGMASVLAQGKAAGDVRPPAGTSAVSPQGDVAGHTSGTNTSGPTGETPPTTGDVGTTIPDVDATRPTQKLAVPAEGRELIRDDLPPTQPMDAPAPSGASTAASGGGGATTIPDADATRPTQKLVVPAEGRGPISDDLPPTQRMDPPTPSGTTTAASSGGGANTTPDDITVAEVSPAADAPALPPRAQTGPVQAAQNPPTTPAARQPSTQRAPGAQPGFAGQDQVTQRPSSVPSQKPVGATANAGKSPSARDQSATSPSRSDTTLDTNPDATLVEEPVPATSGTSTIAGLPDTAGPATTPASGASSARAPPPVALSDEAADAIRAVAERPLDPTNPHGFTPGPNRDLPADSSYLFDKDLTSMADIPVSTQYAPGRALKITPNGRTDVYFPVEGFITPGGRPVAIKGTPIQGGMSAVFTNPIDDSIVKVSPVSSSNIFDVVGERIVETLDEVGKSPGTGGLRFVRRNPVREQFILETADGQRFIVRIEDNLKQNGGFTNARERFDHTPPDPMQQLTMQLGIRELNRRGIAWTDHKLRNFDIVPVDKSVSRTGHVMVLFDYGGFIPVKGDTPWARYVNARAVQAFADGTPFGRSPRPALPTLMYKHRHLDAVLDTIDKRAYGGTLDDIPLTPNQRNRPYAYQSYASIDADELDYLAKTALGEDFDLPPVR